MTNAVTTQEQPNALMPQEKLEQVQRLDQILQESREILRTAPAMTRAFATAAAMRAIEEAITPAMMSDIKNLMNSPLGFKTDRRPGMTDKNGNEVKPYSEQTLKRVIIVALLAGARLDGNQFNIIAGQCYFTKEFMLEAIKSFPGLTHFQMQIGPSFQHGPKSAVMEAHATWCVNGEEFELNCDNVNGRDMRIVINSYSTDGPDMHRGKGESKVLRKVLQRLTGLNLESDPDQPGQSEGQIKSPVTIEHETQGEIKTVLDLDQARQHWVDEASDLINQETTISGATKKTVEMVGKLDDTGWSESDRKEVEAWLLEVKQNRIKSIRENRG